MLVCITVGLSLFVLLTSVQEQFCLVNALTEAPQLVCSDLGLSQLWAQLGLSDDLTCVACDRSACMTGFCKTHMVLEQHSLKGSRQDF